METSTYKIVRVYRNTNERFTIETGLTLEEAKCHCSDPASSADDDTWMDCFFKEEED